MVESNCSTFFLHVSPCTVFVTAVFAEENAPAKQTRQIYLFLQNEMALDDLQPSSYIPSKSTQLRSEYMDLTGATTVNDQTQRVAQSADYAPLHPSTRSWEVEKQHVTIEKIIGKGAFGQVAKGTATGLRDKPGKTTVAFKMLKCRSLFC